MWKIYVGNLSSRIRELELSNEFRPYGLVRSIWIARNPPGYAFVEFDSRQEAHDAIAALDGLAVPCALSVINVHPSFLCHAPPPTWSLAASFSTSHFLSVACSSASIGYPGKHGWRVEMSRRSLGGIRSRSLNRDTRCQECGSRRHHGRDCRFRSSQSSRKSSSPHSRAHKSRDSAKRRRSRSRSPLRDDQLNERSPRNHVDSFPVKSEYSRLPQNVQNRSPRDHENSFAVKSECSRSPQNVQNRSPSACSAMVSEDSPSRKIGSSKSPQNDLIDPHTDGYHSSKECERSFSPLSGSGRSPDVHKGFESDVPEVSEPDQSGLSEHMNCGNSSSPST